MGHATAGCNIFGSSVSERASERRRQIAASSPRSAIRWRDGLVIRQEFPQKARAKVVSARHRN